MKMKKLEHDLLTEKYTTVLHEEEFQHHAPHTFDVATMKDRLDGKEGKLSVAIQRIHFQEGPIKEAGVNGVMNEDLIAMVICRLEHFNQSEFRCRENSMAITKLEEALLWLRKRTMGREQRGIEGTYEK